MNDPKSRIELLKNLRDSVGSLNKIYDQYAKCPFDFIDGLEIPEVNSVKDLEQVLEASFAISNWSEIPFDYSPLVGLKNYSAVNYLYCNLIKKKIGGGHDLAAEVFIRLLEGYEIPARKLRYGFYPYFNTIVLVSFKDEEYVFDPFFGKYYIDLNGMLMPYDILLSELINNRYEYEEVRMESKKSVLIRESWLEMGPAAFEDWMTEEWDSTGMDYILRERKYTRHIDFLKG